eukprot:COSAG01_NODE_7452_length_3206_cov_3.162858_5_plen_132_part_00
MELERLKDEAFRVDDFDECARLRALQVQLLALPPSAGVGAGGPGGGEMGLASQLGSEVRSVEGELDDLASLRREVEAELAQSAWASLEPCPAPADPAQMRAETMRAVAELEQMKQRLMGGRSLEVRCWLAH